MGVEARDRVAGRIRIRRIAPERAAGLPQIENPAQVDKEGIIARTEEHLFCGGARGDRGRDKRGRRSVEAGASLDRPGTDIVGRDDAVLYDRDKSQSTHAFFALVGRLQVLLSEAYIEKGGRIFVFQSKRVPIGDVILCASE